MVLRGALHIMIGSLLLSGGTALASGWTGSHKVIEIYPSPNNNGVLVKQDVMIDPNSCAFNSYYVLEKDNAMFSEMYSLLMSAQARGAEVQIHLAGCSTHTTPKPKISTLIVR